jgi:CubicO group peptidase (beta-lactamase class C family)
MTVTDFLLSEIALGSFPSASYAVGSSSGIELLGAHGHAVVVPMRIPATTETIYDCASATKVLITTMLVLQAVAEGRIALDDEFDGFTYRSLLTHTSGLTAWLPMYDPETIGDYRKAVRERGPAYEPGTRVVYSDLNFFLLWYALTEIFGDYLAAVRTRIFEPLGLKDSYFNPPPSLLLRIAATEFGQRFEVQKLAKRAFIEGARHGLMWGDTNDGNSFHHGGTAANAGLFATARDAFRIVQGFVRGELVPLELVREATRNQTAHLDDARGLGWQLPTPDNDSTRSLSPRAFGHTGFTGTSVWVDPEIDRIFVFFTNRVHPCAAPIPMQRLRGEFHRLAR